jgi:hypothetical protein
MARGRFLSGGREVFQALRRGQLQQRVGRAMLVCGLQFAREKGRFLKSEEYNLQRQELSPQGESWKRAKAREREEDCDVQRTN